MSVLVAWVFAILVLFSLPVAFALLGGAGIALLSEGRPLAVLMQRLYTPTQSFPMLAIPFFILAGSLMMSGRFGEYLITFAKLLVGRFRGGMGQVSILGSVMFGGVSGSAVADASALGNALIPVQVKEGYAPAFAAAINASSSTISLLIPPSIPLILFGLTTSTSIIDLFVAGVLPGLILGLGLLSACWFSAWRRGLPASPLAGGFAAWRGQIVKALPALLMPVFVIGSLRFGIATPTEVSVLAVAYALLVGLLVYRDLTPAGILRALTETAVMTGAVLLIIMASSVVQWILTLEQVPQLMTQWIVGHLHEPWMIILAMNVIMLIVGMVLDLPAAILLLSPLFIGLAAAVGMDPVQLGLIMVINLAIGLYTPPVGTTLFISATIARASIGQVVAELWPFFLVSFTVLLLVSYFPALTIY